ncbi:uncharacterized protein [Nothobranchius furzeri]|uniref:uncharacterized protein n=1 Tax=Nothobranchius furzeri TaxID=105023 RepID=UPI003904CE98
MVEVFGLGLGVDQDVIQVGKHPPSQHVAEDIVYEALKNGGAIAQPKGHDLVLPVTGGCDESGLPLISSFNTDQIVGAPEVQLGEDPRLGDGVQGRCEERQRMTVFDCDFVQTSVIDTGAEITLLFPDKEEACGTRGGERSNETLLEDLVNIFLHGSGLGGRERKKAPPGWTGSWLQLDFHVVRAVRRQCGGAPLVEHRSQVPVGQWQIGRCLASVTIRAVWHGCRRREVGLALDPPFQNAALGPGNPGVVETEPGKSQD